MAVAVTNANATALMTTTFSSEPEPSNTSVVVVAVRQPPVRVPTDLTSTYAAVGGVVGGVAVTAALIGGCWIYQHRRRERQLRDRGVVEDTQETEELP